MNTSRNIKDLPLEVLGLIFKKLPSLEDRLCLAQVHPHVGFAFSCHYGQRFKHLNVTEQKVLSVLLPLCGSMVEHINGDFVYAGTVLKLVEMHCPDLQSINLYICEKNLNSIKSFLTNVKSLRSMTIAVAWQSTTFLGIFELLKFQPSLRRLCLDLLPGNELLEVRKLVNLEELIIYCCMDKNLNIHELSYHLRELRTLHVFCRGFTAPMEFGGVPCPALRELHLGENRYYSFEIRYPSTPAILKWILSHAETLEILTLNINIKVYKPEKVIYKILSECKNLRYLCMRISHKVDTDFAHRVVKIVSESGVRSEELPLDLNFYNQSIHEDIQEVMANTSSKQLITIKNFFVMNI